MTDFQNPYSVPFRGSDVVCKDPSLTQQQFAEDADINVMLERFKVTGQLPRGVIVPEYGDFRGVSDYRSAADILLRAQQAFMQMPASVRSRFGNDPHKFLEFVHDDKNRAEAEKLGLVRAPVPGVSGANAPDVTASSTATGGGDKKPA